MAEDEFDKAIAEYAKAAELDVLNTLARNNIAWIMVIAPDGRLWDAPSCSPWPPMPPIAPRTRGIARFRATLGAVHYRCGNWQAAIDELEKSAALETSEKPDDLAWRRIGIGRFLLAMAYWQLGHQDQARQLLRRRRPVDREARSQRRRTPAIPRGGGRTVARFTGPPDRESLCK